MSAQLSFNDALDMCVAVPQLHMMKELADEITAMITAIRRAKQREHAPGTMRHFKWDMTYSKWDMSYSMWDMTHCRHNPLIPQ